MRSLSKVCWILLLSALAACQGRSEPAALPAKSDFLIFLLIGQSNMAGRGKPVEKDDLTAHPRVLVFGKPQTWSPAVDPLHWDKPTIAGVGLGTTFGKVIAESLPGKTIGLVPAAFGGSAIKEWARDGKHYTTAVARARAALKDGTLAGILWHQGESDVQPESAKVYAERLDQLVKDLRADLDAGEAPFIAGTLSDRMSSEGAVMVNAALRGLPARQTRTGCVEAKGLPLASDGVHFTATAYRDFGRRYAAEWQRITRAAKSK